MRQQSDDNFKSLISRAIHELVNYGSSFAPDSWQGIVTKDNSDYEMIERANLNLYLTKINPDLDVLRKNIEPDIPWCDNHFMERVGGVPLNPGHEYKNWKFFRADQSKADAFLKAGGKFSHTYMERYWPKRAASEDTGDILISNLIGSNNRDGIRYEYGDLNDLVNLLSREPKTRQAYLPVWFPEDTGSKDKQRVPCTLGYLFFLRGGQLHINYYIRACDAFKHFRNDIYLTVRLLLWVLEELKINNTDFWQGIEPGSFNMYIANFHCFKKEIRLL